MKRRHTLYWFHPVQPTESTVATFVRCGLSGHELPCQSGVWSKQGTGTSYCPTGTIYLSDIHLCVDGADSATTMDLIPAIDYCAAKGMTVPDRGQMLAVFFRNSTVHLTDTWYWTSTPYPVESRWYSLYLNGPPPNQTFNSWQQSTAGSTNSYRVRCVKAD